MQRAVAVSYNNHEQLAEKINYFLAVGGASELFNPTSVIQIFHTNVNRYSNTNECVIIFDGEEIQIDYEYEVANDQKTNNL